MMIAELSLFITSLLLHRKTGMRSFTIAGASILAGISGKIAIVLIAPALYILYRDITLKSADKPLNNSRE